MRGISLRRKLDFSAKKNEFPFSRLWISSGDTAGNLTNCFQIRSEMKLLLKCRHFSLDTFNGKMYPFFMADDFFQDMKLWLTQRVHRLTFSCLFECLLRCKLCCCKNDSSNRINTKRIFENNFCNTGKGNSG